MSVRRRARRARLGTALAVVLAASAAGCGGGAGAGELRAAWHRQPRRHVRRFGRARAARVRRRREPLRVRLLGGACLRRRPVGDAAPRRRLGPGGRRRIRRRREAGSACPGAMSDRHRSRRRGDALRGRPRQQPRAEDPFRRRDLDLRGYRSGRRRRRRLRGRRRSGDGCTPAGAGRCRPRCGGRRVRRGSGQQRDPQDRRGRNHHDGDRRQGSRLLGRRWPRVRGEDRPAAADRRRSRTGTCTSRTRATTGCGGSTRKGS